MKSLSIVLLLCSAVFAQIPAGIQTKIFSAPNAGTGLQEGTFPAAINSTGIVAGSYVDSSGMTHGFLYSNTTGKLSEFDAFGASSVFTTVTGINDGGTVVGYYNAPFINPQGQTFGFLRTPQGTYTRFGASIGESIHTYPVAINASGVAAGVWNDPTSTDYPYNNCFLGKAALFTTFSPPNRGNGCSVTAINTAGTVVGFFQDMQNVLHGFVRDSQGGITVFDPPGSTATWATSINTSGQIAGYFNTLNQHGDQIQEAFIRNADGSFTPFTVHNALTMTNGVFTPNAVAINDAGETAGAAVLNGGFGVGWTRSPKGVLTQFQSCGQTGVVALNNAGHLTGFCGGVGQMLNYEGFTF